MMNEKSFGKIFLRCKTSSLPGKDVPVAVALSIALLNAKLIVNTKSSGDEVARACSIDEQTIACCC